MPALTNKERHTVAETLMVRADQLDKNATTAARVTVCYDAADEQTRDEHVAHLRREAEELRRLARKIKDAIRE
jgi:hypothetical protein